MAKTPTIGIFALIILVQIPFIFAIECTQTDPEIKDTCNEILKLNLTLQEKESLISNLEYNENFFPDHNYIYQRNTNLEIKNAPNGVETKNSIYIKNAWADIFSFMPLVLYNNELYVPTQTTVQTGFNYNVEIPSEYYNFVKKEGRECRQTYSLEENSAENKIYVNDQYQGSGNLVAISLENDSEIKSIFEINVKVKINHYQWEYDDGWSCKYEYSEYKTDNVKIENKVNVKLYKNNLSANLEIVNPNSNLVKPNFSNSVEISFENSEYNFYEFTYSIDYSKEPYFIYILKATDYNQEQINNVLKKGDDFLINNLANCEIKAFDFFNVLEKACDDLDNKKINFSITTDKFKYNSGEEIKVNILPKNVYANLTYGNQSILAKDSGVFVAELGYNKITATYKNLETKKLIFVENETRTKFIFNLGVFGFLNYFFYKATKKCFGRLI